MVHYRADPLMTWLGQREREVGQSPWAAWMAVSAMV